MKIAFVRRPYEGGLFGYKMYRRKISSAIWVYVRKIVNDGRCIHANIAAGLSTPNQHSAVTTQENLWQSSSYKTFCFTFCTLTDIYED